MLWVWVGVNQQQQKMMLMIMCVSVLQLIRMKTSAAENRKVLQDKYLELAQELRAQVSSLSSRCDYLSVSLSMYFCRLILLLLPLTREQVPFPSPPPQLRTSSCRSWQSCPALQNPYVPLIHFLNLSVHREGVLLQSEPLNETTCARSILN